MVGLLPYNTINTHFLFFTFLDRKKMQKLSFSWLKFPFVNLPAAAVRPPLPLWCLLLSASFIVPLFSHCKNPVNHHPLLHPRHSSSSSCCSATVWCGCWSRQETGRMKREADWQAVWPPAEWDCCLAEDPRSEVTIRRAGDRNQITTEG